MSKGPQLKRGAVVTIDALGFKGIWSRHDPVKVIEELQKLSDTTISEMNELEETARRTRSNFIQFCRPAFLSDTVVFGVATKSVEQIRAGLAATGLGSFAHFDQSSADSEAVRLAALLTAQFVRSALVGPVPLAYRGAIAFGEFCMTERFMVGSAVDEAATLMNATEGALIVGGPSVSGMELPAIPWSEYPLMKYVVPWKPPRLPETTWVVCPFAGTEESEHVELLSRLRQTFPEEPSGGIKDKLENTLAFLAAARTAEHSIREELLARARSPF